MNAIRTAPAGRLWSVTALLLFAAVTWFVFYDLLMHGREWVISLGGDGCKNMFTYVYHVLYGKGLWFTGMNYPYGEHLVFTDATPILSVPLAWLNRYLHFSNGGILLIMYYSIAIAFLTGLWFTYRVLMRFGVHPLLAMAGAILTLCLSPQMSRVFGHYALSYMGIIPALFYWSLRYYETDQKKYLLYLLLLILAASFCHMYFLGMCLIWMLGYVSGYVLLKRRKPGWVRHAGLYALTFIVAFGLMQGMIVLTDPVHDRPRFPLSPERSDPLRTAVVSEHSFVWLNLKKLGLIENLGASGETIAYFGWSVVFLTGIGLLLWCYSRMRKKQAPIPFDGFWVYIGTAVLIFAAFVPFVWTLPGFRVLMSPLRQFRTLERFSWISYHIFAACAIVVLQALLTYFKQRRRWLPAVGLCLLTLGVWIKEARGSVQNMQEDIGSGDWNYHAFFAHKVDSWTYLLKQHGRKADEFEAIITAPYVHIGSEKIWVNDERNYSLTMAYMMARELHLPVMDVNMSRTSWQQAFDQVKFNAGVYVDKPVLHQLKTRKPLLMFHYAEDERDPEMDCILRASDSLGTERGCTLYAFYPARLFALQRQAATAAASIAHQQQGADTMIFATQAPWLVQHFDQGTADAGFAGNGLRSIHGEDSTLFQWTLTTPADTSLTYEFSVWTKALPVGTDENSYRLIFLDGAGRELQDKEILTKTAVDNEPGLWLRSTGLFTFPAGTTQVKVQVYNKREGKYLALDELLIRPLNATVISRFPNGQVLVNNHRLRSPEVFR